MKNTETKAVKYFLENLTTIDKSLEYAKLSYKKETEGKPTRIFLLADAIGEISLIKDSIPNKEA